MPCKPPSACEDPILHALLGDGAACIEPGTSQTLIASDTSHQPEKSGYVCHERGFNDDELIAV